MCVLDLALVLTTCNIIVFLVSTPFFFPSVPLFYVHVHVSFISLSLLFPSSSSLHLSPSLPPSLSLSLLPSLSQISVGNSNDAIDFYHHDSSVRLSALRSLKSIIIDGSSCSRDYDQEFISSVLLSRLSDDDPNVDPQMMMIHRACVNG